VHHVVVRCPTWLHARVPLPLLAACRPLSKTVRFNVLRVIPSGTNASKGFSSF
jgi:hypothetical protein